MQIGNRRTSRISDGIPLHLAKLSAGVRGGRIPHHAAVVLGMGLLPVPPEEKPPVIRDFSPDDGEQFRVGCLSGLSSRRTRLFRCGPMPRLLYSFCTAALRASARRMTPARVKEGIGHVASVFDRVLRADTRPAAGV